MLPFTKLSAAIYGISQLCMPHVPTYNEIHECIGGEIYIALMECQMRQKYPANVSVNQQLLCIHLNIRVSIDCVTANRLQV